jgi:alkanesulfonate monooxygenase SsuD/methylene tetrahydromethanopterin reductase-like flavin-dependent oxidoreductase (luciferase family)
MVMVFCGRNETELKRRANFAYQNWVPELRDQPFEKLTEALADMFTPLLTSVGASFCPLVGTPESVIEQVNAYADAGVEELMIQWWDVDDIEGLEMYSEHILSRL